MAQRVVPGALQRTRVPGAVEIVAKRPGCAQAASQHSVSKANNIRFLILRCRASISIHLQYQARWMELIVAGLLRAIDHDYLHRHFARLEFQPQLLL
jgi:hypothetical protein